MQRFKEKHILMDTNLLIAISKYSAFGFFDDFLKELEDLKIKAVIEEATLFEFKRGSRKQAHLDDKNKFLDLLLGAKENQMVLQSSTSKEIINVGIYTFNEVKYEKCQEDFKKAK